MKCPKCKSVQIRKNGRQNARQRYLCKDCGRQFLEPIALKQTTAKKPHPVINQDIPKGQNLSISEVEVLVSKDTEIPVLIDTDRAIPPNIESKAKDQTKDQKTNIWPPVCKNGHHPESELNLNLITHPQKEITEEKPPELIKESIKELIKETVANCHTIIHPATPNQTGVAILLLDVENLRLDPKIEQFLGSLCQYPLHIKIAFANWRNLALGNLDTELHKRGYQLVHAPSGPNNADGKMLVVGSSLFLRYPHAKEVVVCSSDSLLVHLCNELSSQGLIVYRVWRQDKNIVVCNYQTGGMKYYSAALGGEVPDFENLLLKLQDWMNKEQNLLTERLDKLSNLATLFDARSQIYSSTNNNGHNETNHQIAENVITVYGPTSTINFKIDASLVKDVIKITSKSDLEKAVSQVLQIMEAQSPHGQVSVSELGLAFSKLYGISVTQMMKSLGINGKFTTFLKSSSICDINGSGLQILVKSK